MFNENNRLPNDALTKELNVCPVVRPVTIQRYMHPEAPVGCQGPGCTEIETHRHFVERRWSMTARGLMDILYRKLHFVYKANLTGKAVQPIRVQDKHFLVKRPNTHHTHKRWTTEGEWWGPDSEELRQREFWSYPQCWLLKSRLGAATSKWMGTTQWKNQTKISWCNKKCYKKNILLIATKYLICWNSIWSM